MVIILYSCNGKEDVDQNPDTLEGKRTLLEQKKEELRQLESEIAELTSNIIEIDPSLEKKKKIVTTTVVTSNKFEKFINIEGVVITDKSVNVVSEVPGRVIDLKVQEGDYVKKGDLIARLDLESYNKQKAEIQTQLELARDINDRQSKLWAQNIGSEVQYLQAKNNVERLEKSLAVIEFQLSKSFVYAPISGVVDREMTKQGELASPGMPIVQLINTRDVKVSADLPERYLNILKRGMTVDVHFPSLNMDAKGRVTLLGRSIDPANRTLGFEVDVPNPGSVLKPNLLSELKIKEKSYMDTIILPIELIQEDVTGKRYILKVANEGGDVVAKRVYVKVGDVYEGNALITDGLHRGDEIIIDGARLVNDGETIMIANEISSVDE